MRGGTRLFDAERVASAHGACDQLISLKTWHSPSVDRLLARLAPRCSVGFFSEFDVAVRLDFGKHSAELAFDIPRALDASLRLDDFAAPPVFGARLVEQARRVRRMLPPGLRVLAVHADTAAEKMWPRERFLRLLDLFLGRRPEFLALVLGSEDLRLDAGRHGDRVIPAYGLPLGTAVQLVGGADVFVGIDSSLLHAADVFRVPGVGLFGSTSPHEWGFRFARHRHVRARGGLSRLREHTVLAALEDLLGELASCPPRSAAH
jgi:hypothetical protein